MTKQHHSPTIKAAALAAGIGMGLLSNPLTVWAGSEETVQGLYTALSNTMKNGRALGQIGRFTQLAPIIRRSFDITSMARLSVGPSWSGLTELSDSR